MSIVYYAVLVVVSLSSVVFGLEWLSEPPPVWKPVAVASVKQPAKQPVKQVTSPAQPATAAKVAVTDSAATSADANAARAPSGKSAVGGPQQTAMAPSTTDNAAAARAPLPNTIMTPEPAAETNTATAPQCDVQACSAAYFTFDPADCTYQPIDGPRRLCTKGTPPAAGAAQAPATEPATDAAAAAPQVSNKCDVEACKRAYFTFNPADCTYRPSDGPRRLCTKGTPPKPDTAQAPTQETAQEENVPAEPQAIASVPAAPGDNSPATAPQVSNRCDVDACNQAYFTFNPADCTYQPSDGPRRLCTKGTPPKPDTAQTPAQPPVQETASDAPQAIASVSAPPNESASAAAPQVSNKCDVEACKRAYFTFNPADCTYRPSDGPRRLCTKGTPPRPDSAQAPPQEQAPAQDAEPKETDSSGSVGAAPREAAQAPSCNVQACAAAYFTFDPADCTYQPSNGPRRLCTK